MSKRIIFSMGARGGVGKTTVISTLADWYAEHKVPVELLDFDDENKANSGLNHFQKSARKIHVDKRDGLDVFIEIVDKTTHPVIVADFGARSGRLTFNWFDSTFEHLKGLDITFTAVGVVTTDPGSVTSVLEWADHLQKKVQYLIVLNELQTEQAVFDVWEKSEQVARFRADLKPKVIRFLSINPDLQKGISNHGASLFEVAQKKVEIPELVGSRWGIRAQQVYQAASKEFTKVKDVLL
jgi:MinD-like ATPase involved in chromosome partitioning or flagellar assembly